MQNSQETPQTQNEQPSTSTPVSSSETPKRTSKKSLAILVVLILILVGGAAWLASQGKLPGATSPDTVAIVNGEKISRSELDTQMAQLSTQLGEDADKPTEQDVVSQMVNERLLLQDMKDRGINVQDQIQTEFDKIKQQFKSEDEFKQALSENKITEDELKKSIEYQLLMESYMNQLKEEKQITVTDEEIQSFYDESVAGQENAPKLEDVHSQIEEQLTQQKLQQTFEQALEKLRSEADVKILI